MQPGADRGLQHFEICFLVRRPFEAPRQCLEIDLRQIDRRRCPIAKRKAGDRFVKQLAKLSEDRADVRQARAELGADGTCQGRDAGDALGEFPRGRVGLDGAEQRADQLNVAQKSDSALPGTLVSGGFRFRDSQGV